jgi:amino acid transporter
VVKAIFNYMRTLHIILIFAFIVLYSAFIFFVEIPIELDVASELTVTAVFFFALFSGFFIARQNDRYSKIVEIISERDGLYSYLYRVFGMVPRIQNEMREIIKKHYTKILNSNNWAYNEFHTSTTITEITRLMSSLTAEEKTQIDGSSPFDGIWQQICQLQQNRKKIIAACNERLVLFQWLLIYAFAFLTITSFGFLPTELLLVDVLKIIFATAVFLVIILLKQLNDLSIFGKDFSKHIANDVLRILEEADMRESGQSAQRL